MSKVQTYGVMHFNIDCDLYVVAKTTGMTAQEFLKGALAEDAGYDLGSEKGWNEAEVANHLFPFVKDDGYIVHRAGTHPTDYDVEDWWEFVKHPGRGHVKVWYINMEEVAEYYKKVSYYNLGQPIKR